MVHKSIGPTKALPPQSYATEEIQRPWYKSEAYIGVAMASGPDETVYVKPDGSIRRKTNEH